MKKSIILFGLGALTLAFSSCLKDKPNVDFSTVKPFVEIVHSGTGPRFAEAAVTEGEDTITRTVEINVTGEYPPTTDVTVTIGLDNSVIAPYVAANPAVGYIPMPAGSFVFPDQTVTIKAGTRFVDIPVTFYKNQLDPAKSYMLPLTIKSASGGGVSMSSNFNTIYYHFIGNDFAGAYDWYYDRWPVPDTTGAKDNNHVYKGKVTFFPVNPSEFTVTTFYYTQPPYHVTFTKTGVGAAATYSNFKVDFTAADINDYFVVPGNLVLVKHPEIKPRNNVAYDPTKQYTYTEALLLFRFFYTTGTRAIIDTYVK